MVSFSGYALSHFDLRHYTLETVSTRKLRPEFYDSLGRNEISIFTIAMISSLARFVLSYSTDFKLFHVARKVVYGHKSSAGLRYC